MNIAVCTLNTPEIEYFAKYTSLNLRSYCLLHGYDFIECNNSLDTNRPAQWSKIKLLQLFVDKYDWLIWIDSDAAIMNKGVNLDDILDNNYDIIITREEHGTHVLNTGVFIIKCSEWGKKFLDRWYQQTMFINSGYFDQSAFGYLYDIDQDVKCHTKIITQRLMNSHPLITRLINDEKVNFRDGDFIIHFYGNINKGPLRKACYNKDPYYVPNRDDIPNLLNKLGLNGQGIEIGVERGIYSEQILSKSNLSKLYLCDPWTYLDDYKDINNVDNDTHDKKLDETLSRVSKFGKRSEILRMSSSDALKYFDDNSLDFVYIDANHTYAHVMEDIINWYPKVKNRGIIAGHDFLDGSRREGEFGVRSAVTEYFKYEPYIYVTDEDWPSWYILKDRPTIVSW